MLSCDVVKSGNIINRVDIYYSSAGCAKLQYQTHPVGAIWWTVSLSAQCTIYMKIMAGKIGCKNVTLRKMSMKSTIRNLPKYLCDWKNFSVIWRNFGLLTGEYHRTLNLVSQTFRVLRRKRQSLNEFLRRKSTSIQLPKNHCG